MIKGLNIIFFIFVLPIFVFASGDSVLKLQDGDDFFGNKDAKIIMITYDSVTCPHCAQFNMDILPILKRKFSDKVLFIHRDMPTDTASLYATVLLNCIGVERAKKIRLLLFQSQQKWAFSRTKQKILENIFNVIKISGISSEEYDRCMSDIDKSISVINKKEELIKKLGIDATPTHFINGRKYEGSQSIEFFEEILNELEKNINKNKENKESN